MTEKNLPIELRNIKLLRKGVDLFVVSAEAKCSINGEDFYTKPLTLEYPLSNLSFFNNAYNVNF